MNVHEIGHMIGLKDRYTDYENLRTLKFGAQSCIVNIKMILWDL